MPEFVNKIMHTQRYADHAAFWLKITQQCKHIFREYCALITHRCSLRKRNICLKKMGDVTAGALRLYV